MFGFTIIRKSLLRMLRDECHALNAESIDLEDECERQRARAEKAEADFLRAGELLDEVIEERDREEQELNERARRHRAAMDPVIRIRGELGALRRKLISAIKAADYHRNTLYFTYPVSRDEPPLGEPPEWLEGLHPEIPEDWDLGESIGTVEMSYAPGPFDTQTITVGP